MIAEWAPARKRVKATRPAIYYRNRHLRRRDTDMDDIRDSFSRLKKDIKHRFTGSKRKVDKKGATGPGENVSGSHPRPESHIVTSGDREQEGNESDADDGSVGPSGFAADENKADWKSTASASAKLLLRGVCDSADAFGPLKSVAGGLCFILDNCEVRFLAYAFRDTHQCFSVQKRTGKR